MASVHFTNIRRNILHYNLDGISCHVVCMQIKLVKILQELAKSEPKADLKHPIAVYYMGSTPKFHTNLVKRKSFSD